MKKRILFSILSLFSFFCYGQSEKTVELNYADLIIRSGENVCSCIDALDITDRSNDLTYYELKLCINTQMLPLMLEDMIEELTKQENFLGQKTYYYDPSSPKFTNLLDMEYGLVVFKTEENSYIYAKHFSVLEEYLNQNCAVYASKKSHAHLNVKERSISENKKALRYFLRAKNLLFENYPLKAIKFFKKANYFDKQFARSFELLAATYAIKRRYNDAIEMQLESIKLGIDDFIAYTELANYYRNNQNYAKA